MGAEKLYQLALEIAALIEQERRLCRKKPFPPSISFELGEWFAKGVADYLNSGEADLEKSLGLKRGPGRSKSPLDTHTYRRAKEIYWARRDPDPQKRPSWKKLGDKYGADARDLRREVDKYESEILREAASEAIGAALGANRQ